jgi:ribonuclease HI
LTSVTIFSDGGARGNPGPAGIGAILLDAQGQTLAEVSEFIGKATNNQAEYLALLAGLEKAHEFNVSSVFMFLDSKLVVEQIAGRWKIKDLELRKIAEKIHAVLVGFQSWKIQHVPREKNRVADCLVNKAIDNAKLRM